MPSVREIAVLDFGSQYTHLIARRIRELGVVSHISPNDAAAETLKNAAGIILSGGPKSVLGSDALAYDPRLFDLDLPILGLCYGHQLMAKHFGGTVASGSAREYGIANLTLTGRSPIFRNVNSATTVWMSHGDHVATLPPGFVSIGETGNGALAAMANEEKKWYGFQFHPEVAHSEQGAVMLGNFIFDICRAEKNWTVSNMLEKIQSDIRAAAGDKNVFLLLSGGVDSTVCFALLEKTLGKDRVSGFHIDHGFMRQNESREVAVALAGIGVENLHVCRAAEEYQNALAGVIDPEQKRKIIGNLFLDITERIMKELQLNEQDWLLGQGTIYPDTIESGGTRQADKIKTHHNRVDRIHDMIAKGLVIEPIKELYKDEVRAVGRLLGLPEHLLARHPFPGPGLAIRCLCAEGSQERAAPLTENIPQNTRTVRLPVRSVGVQGDERSYKHPALLINPPKVDRRIDWQELHRISPLLTNCHRDINRVLFLLAGDPDAVEISTVQPATLSPERIEKLRRLDAAINEILEKRIDVGHIWQMPVVLVPFGYRRGESLVLRPVTSEEAMTVTFAELPDEALREIEAALLSMQAVDFIFYDVTNKPPGTIEWE